LGLSNFNALRSGGFGRSVAIISGGSVLSQLLTIAGSPLLTRLYSPEQFGLLALFVAIVSSVVVVSSFRYEATIPLPEQDEDAVRITLLSLSAVFFCALLVSVVILFAGPPLLTALKAKALIPFAWLIPLALLAAGSYQVLSFWAVRKHEFTALSGTRLRQSLCTLGVQLLGGIGGFGLIGLLAGDTLGRGAGCISLGRLLPFSKQYFSVEGLSRIVQIGRRYAMFPLVGTWTVMLNTLSIQLPFALLNTYFSEGITGSYALAYRVLGLPSSVVGQAVGQVLFARISSRKNESEFIRITTERITIALFALSFPFFFVLFAGGKEIFGHIFGSNWIQAGQFAQLLSPWLFLWLISMPLSNLLTIKERQGLIFLFAVFVFVLRFGAIWIGAQLRSGMSAILFLSISGVIISAIAIEAFSRVAGTSVKNMAQPILKSVGIAIVTLVPLNGIFLLRAPFALQLAVSAISVLAYLALIVKFKVVVLGSSSKAP